MKDCKGCVHEFDKNMAWSGTAVHPCSNCIRVVETPVDKYRPREACPTDLECPFCECTDPINIFSTCHICGKPKKEDEPTQKEGIEEIPEFSSRPDWIYEIRSKINEIIKVVNEWER